MLRCLFGLSLFPWWLTFRGGSEGSPVFQRRSMTSGPVHDQRSSSSASPKSVDRMKMLPAAPMSSHFGGLKHQE